SLAHRMRKLAPTVANEQNAVRTLQDPETTQMRGPCQTAMLSSMRLAKELRVSVPPRWLDAIVNWTVARCEGRLTHDVNAAAQVAPAVPCSSIRSAMKLTSSTGRSPADCPRCL